MKLARLVLIVALSMTESAAAQRFEPATDLELLSAYCVGAYAKRPGAEDVAKRARFRAYLSSRAVFSGRLSGQGANLAAERGDADESVCKRVSGSCLDKCLKTNREMDDIGKCGGACIERSSECVRILRCMTADTQLPF